MGKEKFLWSLDISTTNIGTALWNRNGELIELKHLELKTDRGVEPEYRDIYKAEIFKNYIIGYKERIEKEYNAEIDTVVVEEPLGGSNNQNTVSLLFGFNGMCRYNLYEVFNVYPIKISVYDARKQFCPELVHKKAIKGKVKDVLSFPNEYKKRKKEYIWEKVNEMEPNIDWFYKKDGRLHDKSYDMSDSYCVGYAAFRLYEI
jgi:hypothetical protein